MNDLNKATVNRLQGYLTAYGRKYPNAWHQFDEFREMRGSSDSFEWNDWCFCPLAGAYAIVSNGGFLNPLLGADVGILGALGAWRTTQGIYRFDETVLDAVWETTIDQEIPVEVLYRLPEWCCYIQTPGKDFDGVELYGFFVYLDDDRVNFRDELRFVFDTKTGLVPYPLHLSKSTIFEALESVKRESEYQAQKAGVDFKFEANSQSKLTKIIEPLISLVLYLCSQTSEIPNYENRLKPNYNQRKKRTYPPDKSQVWDVAYRIGAAIRKANTERTDQNIEASGQTKKPHVRRAHWHSFWKGKIEDRVIFLKWLPPIPINVSDENPIIPTIHKINE